ncbi:hypothetical protein [Streptomyces sp. NBC_00316]|uniref:hypothetical protein n=1 Tax=Streptomyces sp. NBC_00316 TaxID=2975710 RepID=UPI002E2E329E|nr:hypothetical protein [Streptomyces sp. NBC_00316]
MLEGVLIAESLRVGAELSGIPLQVIKIARIEVANAAPEQPRQWTLMDFTADERDAENLADQLAACLAPTGGWYVNYNTASEAFVVFPENVFRYPRGDADGREKAKSHARSIGIPEAQLDWQD